VTFTGPDRAQGGVLALPASPAIEGKTTDTVEAYMLDKDDDPQIMETFARFGRAIYMANVLELALVQTLLQIEFLTPAREQFI
jgi:hypothetical protein